MDSRRMLESRQAGLFVLDAAGELRGTGHTSIREFSEGSVGRY
jgi:hypothetical protein